MCTGSHAELVEEARRLLAVVVGRRDGGDDAGARGRGCRRRRTAAAPRPASRAVETGGSRPSTPIRSAWSRVPRRRRSGQASSCTCATTTSRHSRPLERWAVSSRTASPRTPRSASVSAGICWAASVSRKLAHAVWPRCSSARAAASNSAHDGVEVAVGEPGRVAAGSTAAARSRAARRCRPTAPRAPPRPCRRRRARRVARAQQVGQAGGAAAPGLPSTPVEQRGVEHAPRAPARAEAPRPPPACAARSFSRARSGRARRADVGGVEPAERERRAAPSTRSAVDEVGVGGIVLAGVDDGAQRVEQRQHGRLAHQRGVVGWPPRPARPRRRATGAAPGCVARPDRTSTAISDHATPSSRWARRSRSARCSASARSVSKRQHLDPAVADVGRRAPSGGRNASHVATGRCRRRSADGGDPLGGRQQPRAEAARRAQRDHVGAARRRRRGNAGGEVEDAAHLGARGSRRSTGRGRRRPTRSRPSPASARSSATWPGSVSWYSSTKTWLKRAAQLVAVRLGLDRPRAGSGRRSRSRSGRRGRRGTARGRARRRRTPAGRASSRRARRASAGSSPFSRARASTACTSRGEAAGADRAAQRARASAPTPGLSVSSSCSTTSCSGALSSRSGAAYSSGGGVAAGPGRRRRSGTSSSACVDSGAAEPRGDPVAQLLGGLAARRSAPAPGRGRRRAARCGRRSPRPASWSCRCRGRPAPAAARPAWSTTRCWCSSRRGDVGDGVRAHEVVRRRRAHGGYSIIRRRHSGVDTLRRDLPGAGGSGSGWLGAMTATDPLSDLLVLDLTRALAGPHAAMMLGDLGARVIKVESPDRRRHPAGGRRSSARRTSASRRTSSPPTATRSRSSSTSRPTDDQRRAGPAGRSAPTC